MKYSTIKAVLRTARAFGARQAFQVYSGAEPGEEILLKYRDGKTLRLRKGTSDVDTLYQIGVRKELRMPLRFAAPRIIDAGANIGLSIREFLKQYPQARVAGIEPAGDNFSILERNIEEFPGVQLFRAGLWYRNEMLHIENPEAQPWGYRMTPRNSVGSEIPGMTIDQVLNYMGWDRCEILKLDIEGAEREVLNHSSSWISKVDCILVETHDRYQAGCTEAVESIASAFTYRVDLGEKHLLSRVPLSGRHVSVRSRAA